MNDRADDPDQVAPSDIRAISAECTLQDDLLPMNPRNWIREFEDYSENIEDYFDENHIKDMTDSLGMKSDLHFELQRTRENDLVASGSVALQGEDGSKLLACQAELSLKGTTPAAQRMLEDRL